MNSFDNYDDIDYNKPMLAVTKVVIGCLTAIVPVCYFVCTFMFLGV